MFAKSEVLKNKDGKAVNAGPVWKSEKAPEMDSLASAPWLVDHDGDGDLDIYIGNIAGRVMLVVNEGDSKNPAFAAKATALQAGGKDIQVPGGDAGPCVADWDGDGRADLLVGAGDGSVTLFKNTAAKSAAEYAAGVTLLPTLNPNWDKSVAWQAQPSGPGARVKLCVTDWNMDGRPDLLVGDAFQRLGKPRELLVEQLKKRDELHAERDGLYKEMTPECSAERNEVIQARLGKIYEELEPLEEEQIMTGTVWLYLREPAKS